MTKAAASPKPKPTDPLDIQGRLYAQVGCLLDQLEKRDEDGEVKITLKERIAALIAVGRIMTIFAGLRKKEPDDPNAGKSVRKYQGAFQQNEAGGGTTGGRRRRTKSEPDDWFEHTGIDSGDDADGDGETDFDA